MFDVKSFLTVETEEQGSTSFVPVPEGLYTAIIKELKPGSKRVDDAGTMSYWFDCVLTLDAPQLEAITGMKENKLQQRLFLDVTPSGGLDMGKGKNVGLNRVREALGQNRPGMPWSPQKMIGQPLRIDVAHRLDDSVTPPAIRAGIKSFMPLSV